MILCNDKRRAQLRWQTCLLSAGDRTDRCSQISNLTDTTHQHVRCGELKSEAAQARKIVACPAATRRARCATMEATAAADAMRREKVAGR